MKIEELKEMVENSHALFYGELECHLDTYLPEFFSVDVKDVGFDDNHPMNNALFWFTVSWLVEMDCLEYGTSPRGAWLTDKGEEFKTYVLTTEKPITNLIHGV